LQAAESLQRTALWRTIAADATGEDLMNENAERFVIVDLRIPFIRLVLFFVKVALAAIPAAIIVGVLIMVVTALIAALVSDGGFLMMRRWSF
jgi:hypothetical protein